MLINNIFQFIYGDAHGIGYLLDPRYVDAKMDKQLKGEIEEFLFNFPLKTADISQEEEKAQIYRQLTEYIISANGEKNRRSFRFQMLIQKRKSTLEYWLTDGLVWPALQKIAIKVFTMAASSASSERNFSTFGFIHSKLRNLLSSETVRKLVFVKTNANEVDWCPEDETDDTETTEEALED